MDLNIPEEDMAKMRRASTAGGVANGHSSALARTLLKVVDGLESDPEPSKGKKVSATATKRIAALEAAMGKIEVPDMVELDGSLDGLNV